MDIYQLIGTVLCVALSFVSLEIRRFIASKRKEILNRVDNEELHKYLNTAINILDKTIDTTNATFVDKLKQEGKFTKDKALEAYNTTKQQFEQIIGEESKQFIIEMVNDYDAWLKVQIESLVANKK